MAAKTEVLYTAPGSLKENGWTESMIRELLGEPDKLVKNPHHRSGPPMRLFSISRVREAEQGEAFAERKAKAEIRSKAGKAAAKKRAAKLLESVKRLQIEVESGATGIRQAAIDHYNARNGHKEGTWDYTPASGKSDPGFLARITDNYVRHCLTDYDEHCAALRGLPGCREAYLELRSRVDEIVATLVRRRGSAMSLADADKGRSALRKYDAGRERYVPMTGTRGHS